MNVPTLRVAVPGDSDFAYRAKKAAFREYVERAWGWDEARQRELHEQRFAKHDFRVIHEGGADVGILATSVAPECLWVHQIFLLPEHQGRGVGRECMRLVLKEARAQGLPVRLGVVKVNPRALAFYEGLGFERTGETETHYLLRKH